MLTKDLCLVLNFRDAKTFSRNPFKDTHRMVEASGWNKRSDRPGTWVEVPPDTLSVLHVSNVLHVLAGERPGLGDFDDVQNMAEITEIAPDHGHPVRYVVQKLSGRINVKNKNVFFSSRQFQSGDMGAYKPRSSGD